MRAEYMYVVTITQINYTDVPTIIHEECTYMSTIMREEYTFLSITVYGEYTAWLYTGMKNIPACRLVYRNKRIAFVVIPPSDSHTVIAQMIIIQKQRSLLQMCWLSSVYL